jgi:hypothetical protein
LAVPALAVENRPGAITGTVRLTGPPPIIAPFTDELDPEACSDRPRGTRALLLGTNQAVANAIVYLRGGATVATTNETTPVVLDVRDCEFVPRIQVGRRGAALSVRNSDPVLHVVRVDQLSRTNGPKTLCTLAAPYAGFEKRIPLELSAEPLLLRVTSANGHPWMTAYVAVLPQPWAALTDEAGRFTLPDVPAGTYKLYAWHEILGTVIRDVVVLAGRTATADCEFNGPAR